jgi:hypothetical protein
VEADFGYSFALLTSDGFYASFNVVETAGNLYSPLFKFNKIRKLAGMFFAA